MIKHIFEYESVDYKTANVAAEQGKRIARKGWNIGKNHTYCLYRKDTSIECYKIIYPYGQEKDYVITNADRNANDWVILD